MTTRMTAPRLARLDRRRRRRRRPAAVAENPALLGPHRRARRAGRLDAAAPRGRRRRSADVVRVLRRGRRRPHRAHRVQARTPLHVALQLRPDLVAAAARGSAPQLDAAERRLPRRRRPAHPRLDDGAALVDRTAAPICSRGPPPAGPRAPPRLLLERGADADDGALHAAARRGRLELVQLLLDGRRRRRPARPRHRAHRRCTTPSPRGPTATATEVVRVLLGAGADVNATTNDGASALDISRVAAARHRRGDAGRATGNDALAEPARRPRRHGSEGRPADGGRVTGTTTVPPGSAARAPGVDSTPGPSAPRRGLP